MRAFIESNFPLAHIRSPSALEYGTLQITNKLNSQMGAYDIEDAMAWKKKIELIIDQVQYKSRIYLFLKFYRIFSNLFLQILCSSYKHKSE